MTIAAGVVRRTCVVVGFLVTVAYAWIPIVSAGGQTMRVELDVFSGRPNPSWDLPPQVEQELRIRLRSLLKSTSSGAALDKLGYRGLIVTASGQMIDGCSELVISEGIVRGKQTGGIEAWTDTNRDLERWLLGTGQRHLAPDLYQAIVKEF